MKLHLGCGKTFIPGYCHIDVIEFPHIDIIHSVESLPMVQDESCDVVYACHVLEHFHKKQILPVLKEWLRVLKKGGILRISVPDVEALLKVYQQTHDLNLIIGPLFGRGNYLYNIHYTAFDLQTLSAVLSEAGAIEIARYDWRTTEHASVDDYSQAYIPHMAKKDGTLISLNMQAFKKDT
jgi:predicted SAM-dependent methyltransferase